MANEEKFAPIEGKYLTYLDQPLVREGQTICYGDKSEKCFLILEIMSYKKEHGRDIPDNILIQVVDSKDPGKIIKQGEKEGISNALSIGMIWLERANRS